VQYNYRFAVYQATPAGILAAVSASVLGFSAVIVESSNRIGGLMTSGLNAADTVNSTILTGGAEEFFRRAKIYYKSRVIPIRVESRVATIIFSDMLRDYDVKVIKGKSVIAVEKQNRIIKSVRLSDGSILHSDWWVDASYEGDLLNIASISTKKGREASIDFDESLGGVGPQKNFFPWGPAIIPVKTENTLLKYVDPYKKFAVGSGDENTQSYCIRPTLTSNPKNMIPIPHPKSDVYDSLELFRRIALKLPRKLKIVGRPYLSFGTTFQSAYFNLSALPNDKFDMNSGPAAPINNPMLTKGWVDGSSASRDKMRNDFRDYTLAVLYFIQNDKTVPLNIREFFGKFGLPADEYEEYGNLPPDVYVREGRRLVGDRVFTQTDVENGGVEKEEMVAKAQYHLDCKPVSWSSNEDGSQIVREGMFFSQRSYPYNIPSWLILPKAEECLNLFSVCAVSASHVAFGSIRMEPTWMTLGSISACIAKLSEARGRTPHGVRAKAIRRLNKNLFST